MRQIQKSDLRYDFLRNCLSAMFPMVIVIAVFIIGICMPVTTNLIENRFDYKLLFIGTSVGDLVVYPILLLFGMSMAFVQFDFLSSKSKSNIVMSFGISRYRLFLNRIFPSIIAMFIAIFIPLTIVLFENGKYIGIESYTIKTYIFFIFSFFTIALLGFVAFTLASLLASTRIESLFFGISFIALPYVIISFFSLCFKTFLTGYSYRFMPLFKDPINSLYMLNPLNLSRTKIDFWGENILSSIWDDKGTIRYDMFTENAEYAKKVTSFPLSVYMPFIAWALLSVFVLFVAYRVFRNRKMEVNGMHKSSQFAASFTSLFMILAGAALSFKTDIIFFFTPAKSYYLTVLIAFTLIISVICLFLFFSKQKRKRALITLFVFLIVILSAVFSFIFGGLGFSSRVPSLEKIDKIAISLPYKIDTSDISNLDVLSGFETDEEKKLITNIHKMLIEDNSGETSYKDLFIGYYLKSGERVFREYTDIPLEVLSEITKLYDSKTVKDYVYSQLTDKALWSADKNPEYYWAVGPSFNLTDKAVLHFDNVNVTLCAVDSNKNTDITEKLTNKRFDTLIRAIAEDTRALNSKEFYTPKEPPILVISLIDNTLNDSKFNQFSYITQTHYSFYIYQSMEKTIAYLSFLGVYDVLNEKSEIVKIELYDCKNKDYYTQIKTTLIRYQSYDTKLKLRYTSALDLGIDFTTPYKTITNKDDIAKIRKKLYPNYLAITEDISLAKITYKDGIAFFVVKDFL